MAFIPVEGQHYHNIASKIRMYLKHFKGEDLKKAQSLLRKVISEFNPPPTVKQEHHTDLGMVTTEYPDGRYEVRIDLTKQEEE